MNFYKAFINFLKSFYKAFYKAFVINLFGYTLPHFNIIYRENIIEIPLTSEKHRQAKFCLVDAWS